MLTAKWPKQNYLNTPTYLWCLQDSQVDHYKEVQNLQKQLQQAIDEKNEFQVSFFLVITELHHDYFVCSLMH